ncbi:hypothetical protein MRX96_039428 [Rhipicephalus microplus]
MSLKRYLAVPDRHRDVPDELRGQAFCIHTHNNDVSVPHRPWGDTSVRGAAGEALHCCANPTWAECSVQIRGYFWFKHNNQLVRPDSRRVCVGFHVASCHGDSTQAAGVDPVLRAFGWAAAVEPRGFILASFSCRWRTII